MVSFKKKATVTHSTEPTSLTDLSSVPPAPIFAKPKRISDPKQSTLSQFAHGAQPSRAHPPKKKRIDSSEYLEEILTPPPSAERASGNTTTPSQLPVTQSVSPVNRFHPLLHLQRSLVLAICRHAATARIRAPRQLVISCQCCAESCPPEALLRLHSALFGPPA